METMKKIITTIVLQSDVKEHIDQNTEIKSFSDWINNSYRDEFMILEKEKERVKQLQWELQLAQEKVKTLEKEVIEKVLNIKAEEWLRTEGLRRSKMPNIDLDAVRRYFNQEFGLELNNKEFRLQLERVKHD